MQVLTNFNLDLLKTIVEKNAKFQKVMLIFDENVSSFQLQKLHKSIEEICIFNQKDINSADLDEIFNGYKLLIFVCAANSFLKINLDLSEFVNIFLPTDHNILPFFARQNFKCSPVNFIENAQNLDFKDDCIFLNQGVDINIYYSLAFNNFFAMLNNILSNSDCPSFSLNNNFFSQKNSIECLAQIQQFEDLKILKKLDLDYKFLPYLDYYLLAAFSLLIAATKQQTLSLVDVYKAAKDNYPLLDVFYAKINNDAFLQLIDLNYLQLKNCLTHSFTTLSNLSLRKLENGDNDFLLGKLRNFCKNSTELYVYLYLFNVFGG